MRLVVQGGSRLRSSPCSTPQQILNHLIDRIARGSKFFMWSTAAAIVKRFFLIRIAPETVRRGGTRL
jgi:hypothetical protein